MGTNLIRTQCEKMEINSDELLVLGKGSKCTKGRYRMSITKKENKKLLYAVQYCKERKIYVAWDLKREGIPIRTVYSIRSQALDVVEDDGRIYYIKKYIEYSGWNEENVIAFYESGISTFINEKLIKHN